MLFLLPLTFGQYAEFAFQCHLFFIQPTDEASASLAELMRHQAIFPNFDTQFSQKCPVA